MKLFEHNLTKENLLLGSIIYYIIEEDSILKVRIPTIKESLDVPDFNLFLSLLIMKPEDYKKIGVLTQIDTESEGIIATLRENKIIRDRVSPYFERYLVGSEISVHGILVDDRKITLEELEFFRKIILVSFGAIELEKVLEESKQEEEVQMSEEERKIIERQQAALKRLEEAKKRKQPMHDPSGIDLSKIIAGVMKEFNMTLKDIKELNYFALYYFFSYVFKIDHYDFMKKAAASGNLGKKSKITHWLE